MRWLDDLFLCRSIYRWNSCNAPLFLSCFRTNQRIGTKIVRVPIKENEDDAVDDTVDDVYGMDWNEEDSNESGRDKF